MHRISLISAIVSSPGANVNFADADMNRPLLVAVERRGRRTGVDLVIAKLLLDHPKSVYIYQ